MANRMLQYFAHAHLKPELAEVSKPFGDLAALIDAKMPESAEKTAGLRKLLEAKDCIVRAAVDVERDREALFSGGGVQQDPRSS